MAEPWKTELFSCFDDIPTLVIGWLVPCYLFGLNAEQIDGSNKIVACIEYALLANCSAPCCIHKSKRTKLRAAYGLVEKPNDLIATWCCTGCAICQEAREMKLRGVQPGMRIPVTSQPQ